MVSTILVVDDEVSLVDSIRFLLEQNGFRVLAASTGPEGLQRALQERPDLVLLDVMLPGQDGFEVCRSLRSQGFRQPVLLLTARDEEIDSVLGLELGADDYITKPFRHRELLARIKAHLRRGNQTQSPELRSAGLELLPERREAFLEGRRLDLTPREFQLLQYFMEHARKALSRERILESVWGYDYDGEARVVNVTIQRLRDKLEADPGQPQRIVTVRGVGYKLEASE